MSSTTAANVRAATPLKFLHPGWFSIVMGLCGLSLLWHRARPRVGDWADQVSAGIAVLAGAVFVVLSLASLLRAHRYRAAFDEDLAHPIRRSFVAAYSVSILLLSTVWIAHRGPSLGVALAWSVGCALQLVVTVWVMARWLKPNGMPWAGVTPVLFIPVVGNVVAPLGGLPLGFPLWSAAQFGIGIFFWPIVSALLFARFAVSGPLPERLLPSVFISIAPPALLGLCGGLFGFSPIIVLGAWGICLFMLGWSLSALPRIRQLEFGVPFWGLSFPLAAFSVLCFVVSDRPSPRTRTGSAVQESASPGLDVNTLAMLMLVLTTIVVAWLALSTVKGLLRGTLLVAEEAAPAQAPAAASNDRQQ